MSAEGAEAAREVPGDPPCEMLQWDSEHFGRRIGRVRGRRLTPEALARIADWTAASRAECLYFLADSGEAATAALAEEGGFRLVDVRITLERRGGGVAGAATAGSADGVEVRAAVAADLPELRRIAAVSHRDSRFFQDPGFGAERAAHMYERWIEKCLGDPAGIVLVPAMGGREGGGRGTRVVGYITAAVTADGGGQIGLFAVDAAARGGGLGGRLIAAALEWCAARGADPVSVVTQGRNVGAQRLYQRFGLLSRDLELWFHRWSRG